VLRGDDKDIIEKKAEALATASAKIAQQAYASQAGAAGGADEAGMGAGPQGGPAGGGKDEVLDAEFEEVDKDKDRKG
jgi:molecular chaperone DnaK